MDALRSRLGDGLELRSRCGEVAVTVAKCIVEAVDHLREGLPVGRVKIPGGSRAQAQPQLHRGAALKDEQRVVVLVVCMLQQGGHHHEGDPSLEPGGRDPILSGQITDPPLEHLDVVRWLAGQIHRLTRRFSMRSSSSRRSMPRRVAVSTA